MLSASTPYVAQPQYQGDVIEQSRLLLVLHSLVAGLSSSTSSSSAAAAESESHHTLAESQAQVQDLYNSSSTVCMNYLLQQMTS